MKKNKLYKQSRIYFILSVVYFVFLVGVVVSRNPDFKVPGNAAFLVPQWVLVIAFAELWQKENKREYNRWFTNGTVLFVTLLLVAIKELIF